MPKQKYLCIQRSQSGKSEKPSPAQMEEMYAKFHAWKEKFQKNIVDMGGKLGGGKVVTSEGATDGPFVEAKEVVGGFCFIEAEDYAQAVELVRHCPGLRFGAIALREVDPLGCPSMHVNDLESETEIESQGSLVS